MPILDVLKTLVLLSIFVILVVFNFRNIRRHHKEKKDAKRKKEIGGFTVARGMKPENNAAADTAEIPDTVGTTDDAGTGGT